jgi:hypothetical protein
MSNPTPVIATDPSTWPKVGDPPFGFDVAADCPAVDDPDGCGWPLYCTRDAGHPMPHVADGFDRIVHVWVGDDGITPQYVGQLTNGKWRVRNG